MSMVVHLTDPKYFALNCKFIAPTMTYEDYLIEVLNGSLSFFTKKRTPFEQFHLVKKQDHGEPDARSSLYSVDFKLLVDQELMNTLYKNKPEVDYSHLQNGLILVHEKKDKIPAPKNNILFNLMALKENDIDSEEISKTVKNLLANLKKAKNLFIYYPYEFSSQTDLPGNAFKSIFDKLMRVIMDYRTREQPTFDTFFCVKANAFFLIYEWTSNGFAFRDQVHETLCGNYRDVKLYSLY